MPSIGIPKIESAKEILPQINVSGYQISGQQTTFYYHIGPKSLDEDGLASARGPLSWSLSMSSAKKTNHLNMMLFGSHWKAKSFFEARHVNVKWGTDEETNAGQEREDAIKEIVKLPEWDACLRRLRAQARDVLGGDFKARRQDKRKAAAKLAIKDAAKSCITRYHVTFDDVIKMTEEAVVELQIEEVMEG